MMKRLLFSLLVFLLMLGVVSAQGSDSVITITYPENGVTYGPWSDTYVDYSRTGGKAHSFQMQVALSEDVAYYRVMSGDEYVTYVNGPEEDAVPENEIVEYAADDLEPISLIGFLSAVQNLKVIAYDAAGTELGRDEIQFYVAVELDDYYEILEADESFAETFVIRDEDLGMVDVSVEQVEVTEEFFTVTREFTYITVRNRFTDETEDHTRVRVTIEPLIPGAEGQEVSLYTFIPKDIVETLNDMTLEGDYEVIDVDPVMMWNFAATSESTTMEFDVHETLEEESLEEISTVAVSDVEVERTQWYFIIPLVLPVILLFGIVYFNRFKKHE